ncbi:hypothetical protein H7J07_04960 [Mycobacterium koreense]|uniref:Uncharacterized protein n=1 Tax=Mycolicibacillus koreensis TaxID=1069220 RepID=A0A7I7SCZ8_9MYCO|nr:hypothetical protein [Mycolicibacillus koreensis]MCV7247608.1 hypothetical protein [Mycolicibacillus koreensis]OSC32817.1 hypothetical protein B8W67_13945 [Mycolicibacillus koreensis]BBY53986.1 hypothetical protein MKOR_12370 [Mycolicibacillus koreensis]
METLTLSTATVAMEHAYALLLRAGLLTVDPEDPSSTAHISTGARLSGNGQSTDAVTSWSPALMNRAEKDLSRSQRGTWAIHQPAFYERLRSVPTSALAHRGICPGTEAPSQMCDTDHFNFIFAGRNVA